MFRALLVAIAAAALALSGGLPIDGAEKKPPRAEAQPSKGASKRSAARTVSKDLTVSPGAAAKEKTETAVFAGGCFWCTEFAFEQLAGVIDVESGYCGGTKASANYEQVHLGITGHAEAIRVTYDPEQISYDDLLDVFFDSHDPTQLNRQGADEGRQYRSAIFYANDEQQEQAQAKIDALEKKRAFPRRIVTKLEPLKEFYPAEGYHQNFARRNPFQVYIQSHAVPKALRVRYKHPDLIRNDAAGSKP